MVCFRFKRAFCRCILLIALSALLQFVVGPQLGSVDADGDGIPESPVALATANTVGASTLSCKVISHRTIRVAHPVAIPAQTRTFDAQKRTIASPVGRSDLRLFCLLRC